MAELLIELATRRATRHLGQHLARVLKGGDLLLLDGPLGSGKTFLVRALCRALQLPARVPVPSPTFTLVHEHETEPPIAHADLYRLDSDAGIEELGLRAQRDAGYLVVVEWGLAFLAELGGDALILRLETEPRRALLRASGTRSGVALKELERCYRPLPNGASS